MLSNEFHIALKDDNFKRIQRSHVHDRYEIFFMLRGKRDFYIDDNIYEVTPGRIVFINPKVIHKSITKSHSSVRRYFVLIPKDFIGPLTLTSEQNFFDCFQGRTPYLDMTDDQFNHILNLFDRIHEEYEPEQTKQPFIIAVLVTELLYYLNKYYHDTHPEIPEVSDTLSRQLVNYLNKHYSHHIDLDLLSKEFFMSTHELCRMFKKETGFTIMEYLTFVRLKEAMILLSSSDKNVTDIGFLVGFNNLNHFIRTFKKHLQITPKQYQLNKQNIL